MSISCGGLAEFDLILQVQFERKPDTISQGSGRA